MATVEFEKIGNVAVVRLNRPDRMNAMGSEMMTELRAAYAELIRDPQLRVGLITGNGRAFSAGRDIKEASLADGSLREHPVVINQDLYMESCLDKPIVTAVNGYAGGSGFYLATRFADFIVAGESAVFQIAEVPRGIPHGFQTGFWASLPRAASLELALGFTITGRRAYDMGLVNEVTSDEALFETAFERAKYIACMPSKVIFQNRQLRRALDNQVPKNVAGLEAAAFADFAVADDAADGDLEFLNRKKVRTAAE